MLKNKAATAHGSLEEAKNRLKKIEADRKALELEVEAKKELISRYANQQFQTRKNEEYRALAHEIDACKQAIFQIEDQEIALMEQSEATQKEAARATQAAAETRKMVDEQVARLGAREQNLKKELERYKAAGLGGIDTEYLATKMLPGLAVGYDTIDVDAAKKEGIVVAYIPDYCYEEVSNHAISMILALNRKLTIQTNFVKSGKLSDEAMRNEAQSRMERLKGLGMMSQPRGKVPRSRRTSVVSAPKRSRSRTSASGCSTRSVPRAAATACRVWSSGVLPMPPKEKSASPLAKLALRKSVSRPRSSPR